MASLLVNISLSLQDPELIFITPYNEYFFPSVELKQYPSEWIVAKSKSNYVALHIPSNRMFEINELFAEIFEAEIKNCLDSAIETNEYITKEVIKEQKELMLNVH